MFSDLVCVVAVRFLAWSSMGVLGTLFRIYCPWEHCEQTYLSLMNGLDMHLHDCMLILFILHMFLFLGIWATTRYTKRFRISCHRILHTCMFCKLWSHFSSSWFMRARLHLMLQESGWKQPYWESSLLDICNGFPCLFVRSLHILKCYSDSLSMHVCLIYCIVGMSATTFCLRQLEISLEICKVYRNCKTSFIHFCS